MNMHNGFVQRVKENKTKPINVIFFGDSITQGWGGEGKEVWAQRYAPLGAVNFGIGGDSTRQVLWRIENGEIEGLSPRLIVLKIGTNNLYGDFNAGSDEEIAAGITKIVTTLRQKLPQTKILLLGLLPRQNTWFSGRTAKINSIIAKLDDGKSVRFLDMSSQFQTETGKVKPELYNADQLHLVKKGYELWADTMQPLFDEMMKQ
jgi:lysophospholipase L1-like esterase